MLKNLMMGTAAVALSVVGMVPVANAGLFASSGLLTPCAEVAIPPGGVGTGAACTAASEAGTAPGASTQSGTFYITYDDVSKLLTVDFDYTGLTALDGTVVTGSGAGNTNYTDWHIHGPAVVGANGFPFFPGGAVFPFPNDDANNPFSGSVTITHALLDTLGLVDGVGLDGVPLFESWLFGDLLYINIHSLGYGTGELRSQLVFVDVPEPASMTLLGAGLMGLGYFGKRRKA